MRGSLTLQVALLAITGVVLQLGETRHVPKSCGTEGQTYSECKGCDGSCLNSKPICPLVCEPGCSCPIGQVVHEGKCIDPDDCPDLSEIPCEIEGQTFSTCKGCDGSCLNPNPICPLVCEPGCSCPTGQVVHEKKCIDPDDCPDMSDLLCDIEGQEYSECKGCDGTCADPNPICPMICEPGCSCVNGTVVHEGKCIPPDDCPDEMKCDIEGQKYYGCAPCEGTCDDPYPPCPKICQPGCACPSYMVVDEEVQKCVALRDCSMDHPKKTGAE